MVMRMRNALFVVALAACLINITNGLRCYQCYSNGLEPCPYEDLRECPRFSFYNRCSVKVRKLITGETFVKRECATGPCHGYDGEYGEDISLQDHCDTRSPEYECLACCRGDGCNRNGAGTLSALGASIAFLLLLRLSL